MSLRIYTLSYEYRNIGITTSINCEHKILFKINFLMKCFIFEINSIKSKYYDLFKNVNF